MSYCTFIAADCDLPEKAWPEEDDPLDIDIDARTIHSGDAKDNYALLGMGGNYSIFTKRASAVALCWNYYSVGCAQQIIDYIKIALHSCETVEIWRVWLAAPSEGLYPSVEERVVPIGMLSPEDIRCIDDADPFSGQYNKHPLYHCLRVVK